MSYGNVIRVPDGDLKDNYYGLLLQGPTRELILKAAEMKLPFPGEVIMPCGEMLFLPDAASIPVESVRCPCGNPRHWLVKWEIDPEMYMKVKPDDAPIVD